MLGVSGALRRAVWITIGAAIMWGLWWWPLRWLTGHALGVMATSTLVYGAGALVLLPFVMHCRGAFRSGGLALRCSAILFALTLVSWNLALIWGQVARVTLLFYLSPVWAVLLAYWLLGQVPDRGRVMAIFLGVGGAVVLFAGPALFGDIGPFTKGDWLGMAAGFLFAASIVSAQKFSGKVAAVPQAFAALVLAAVISGLLGGGASLWMQPPSGVILLGALGIAAVIMVPGIVMLLHGGNHLEPSRVTLLLLLEVPVAAISAALLADEPLNFLHAVAGAMIVLAAILESRTARI